MNDPESAEIMRYVKGRYFNDQRRRRSGDLMAQAETDAFYVESTTAWRYLANLHLEDGGSVGALARALHTLIDAYEHARSESTRAEIAVTNGPIPTVDTTTRMDNIVEEAWWYFLVRWPDQPFYNERVKSAVGPDFVKAAFEEAVREALAQVAHIERAGR